MVRTPLEFDLKTRLWRAADGRHIDYHSDGFVRTELAEILSSAKDLSSTSEELEHAATSWPASYYLSTRRTNLLRPFPWDATSNVLEVGSGCGTITRFLGETFKSVVAVEGDVLRASLGAARVRDQDNVSVVCAPYDALEFDGQFDVVFCIGVLEYAHMYNSAADPFLAVLKGFDSLLSPGGTLVLAIENKLGMKYFAGAAEDHTGVPFDGLEGYRRGGKKGPRTLGRVELEQKLRHAGFSSPNFFYPFPDYKFSRCIVGDRAAQRVEPELAEFITQEEANTYGTVVSRLTFDQRAAWQSACQNGLLPQLANSFLVLASKANDSNAAHPPWDAAAFTTVPRQKPYWMATEIRGLGTDAPVVNKRRMAADLPTSPLVDIRAEYEEPWYSLPTLAAQCRETMHDASCSVTDIAAVLKPWWLYLEDAANSHGAVSGDELDAIPQNIVETKDGLRCFDRELVFSEQIAAHIILSRGLFLLLVSTLDEPSALQRLRVRPIGYLMMQLANAVGCKSYGLRELWLYCQFESTLQRVLGKSDRSAEHRFAALLGAHFGVYRPTSIPRKVKGFGRRATGRLRRMNSIRTRI